VLGEQIGQPGQFGRAHRATHKATGEARAVKVVSKTKFTQVADVKLHFKNLREEIAVMRRLHHENVISMSEVYESVGELFIVMELAEGGELFDRIRAQATGSYSEKDAQSVLRQICQGLDYLHKNQLAHCDLKPDNFLFKVRGSGAAHGGSTAPPAGLSPTHASCSMLLVPPSLSTRCVRIPPPTLV